MQGKNKTTLGQWTCELVHTALSLHHRPSGAGQGYPGPTLAVPRPRALRDPGSTLRSLSHEAWAWIRCQPPARTLQMPWATLSSP